jgi:hypothetical protein
MDDERKKERKKERSPSIIWLDTKKKNYNIFHIGVVLVFVCFVFFSPLYGSDLSKIKNNKNLNFERGKERKKDI